MAFSDLVALVDRAAQKHLGGVEVTYVPQFGAPVLVTGIFSEQFVLAEGGAGMTGVEQVGPAIFFRLDDLPIHPDSDNPLITIGGVGYRIRERQVDGMGGIRLLLHRAVV